MSENNGYATREALFATPPVRRYTEVEVEGYGKWRCRSLNASEANEHENARWGKDGKINRAAVNSADCRLIAISYVSPKNNDLLFSREDVPRLMEMDAALINALAMAAVKLNGGLTVTIEDAEKNSEQTPA